MVQVNYAHGIDMQQLFAQLAVDFLKGRQWWLRPDDERVLEQHNTEHRSASVTRERLLDALDLEQAAKQHWPAMTPTEVLLRIGFANPTNKQAKECASVLREFLGDHKRINGQNKWRVPLRQMSGSPKFSPTDIDKY